MGNPELGDVLEALKDLWEETQDWEDALGEERPTLIACRREARRILDAVGAE
jgi:hypothetical protein